MLINFTDIGEAHQYGPFVLLYLKILLDCYAILKTTYFSCEQFILTASNLRLRLRDV